MLWTVFDLPFSEHPIDFLIESNGCLFVILRLYATCFPRGILFSNQYHFSINID